MFLSEVTLERFKAAFKPQPIPLRPFNVIIGRNGSGKSTLLEALQFLDSTIRRDAREACNRYFGSTDLVNLRSRSKTPYFGLQLRWNREDGCPLWRYELKVWDRNGTPEVAEEHLCALRESGQPDRVYVKTVAGERWVHPTGRSDEAGAFPVREPDRLALPRAAVVANGDDLSTSMTGRLAEYWERAVFLRLSPHQLARGAFAKRKSYEPLLDEEGQTLPSLLSELDEDQREELIENLRGVLPGMMGVEVSRADFGRDARVYYSLLERMPYVGRSGKKQFPIPAWMLSEGTRRITAILALLARQPGPTLLCIEEVENGLDPWTVRVLLRQLQSAADHGVQVVLTTHSPWLLDDVPIEAILRVQRVEGNSEYRRFIECEGVLDFDPSVPAGTRYVQLEG